MQLFKLELLLTLKIIKVKLMLSIHTMRFMIPYMNPFEIRLCFQLTYFCCPQIMSISKISHIVGWKICCLLFWNLTCVNNTHHVLIIVLSLCLYVSVNKFIYIRHLLTNIYRFTHIHMSIYIEKSYGDCMLYTDEHHN